MRPLRFKTRLPIAGTPHIADVSAALRLATRVALFRGGWPHNGRSAAEPANRQRSAARVAAVLGQPATNPGRQLQRDEHGRPSLPVEGGLDLSISHAGRCWLLAISGNGRRLGVDIESPRPLPRAQQLAERYFDPTEAAQLAGLSESARVRAFLRLWCAREAILKAHGRGIAFGLSRLCLGFDAQRLWLNSCDAALGTAGSWRLREFAPAPGMIGVLAWRGPAAVLRGYQLVD